MVPIIALIGCTIFVLLLLRLEHKASKENSFVLWIPVVWMLIIASRPLNTWFLVHGDFSPNNEAGSDIDRYTLTVLGLVAGIVLLQRRADWTSKLRQHKWLLLLFGYMFVSTFWSDITLIALKRWVREIIFLVMALVILTDGNPLRALGSVLRRTAYLLIPFSILLIRFYPAWGRQYGRFNGVEIWTGVTGQKNHLGRLCMIAIFFLLWSLYRYWRTDSRLRADSRQAWADICIIAMGLYLLKGSDSSTSLATLFVGIAIFLGLLSFRALKLGVPHIALLIPTISFIILGTITPFLGGSTVAAFTPALGRDSTLTGRTEVWAEVLPARSQRPLLGYGIGSFWTDARRLQYEIPTAHNGYLDVLLELGDVGFGLYVVWLLSCTRKLYLSLQRDYELTSLAFCLVLMGLLYNISESALNTFTEEMTAVMALATMVASCAERPEQSSTGEATQVQFRAGWRVRTPRPSA